MFIDELDKMKKEFNKENSSIIKKKEEINKRAKEEKEKLDESLRLKKIGLDNYGDFIESHSSFKIEDIVLVLTDLLTFYNGEKYSYHINGTKWYIVTEKLNKLLEILGFVKTQDLFSDKNLVSKLLSEGLIMEFVSIKNNSMNFYSYINNNVVLRYNLNDETENEKLIKDFIDYVIDYRVKNNKNTTLEDLRMLEKEYLKSKREDLMKIYKNLELSEQQELNDRVASRRLKLDELK